MARASKKRFIKAAELGRLSPLPQYFEEIYPNQKGLKKLGFRGDKNYLFYSKNQLGTMYYEVTEMEKSAKSVYRQLSQKQKRTRYFSDLKKSIRATQAFIEAVEAMDLESMDIHQLSQLFNRCNEQYGECFSYYVVSEPYRMKLFEDRVRHELSKRVAKSRIDTYMAMLAVSEKKSTMAKEEEDWLTLILKLRTNKVPKRTLSAADFESRYPNAYRVIKKHFDTYKLATLGDGKKSFDITQLLRTFVGDTKRPAQDVKNRLNELKHHTTDVLQQRKKLYRLLYLDQETQDIVEFLADMGHFKLLQRTDSWGPLLYTNIKIDIALSAKLGYKHEGILNYMTPKEHIALEKKGTVIPADILLKRKGSNEEFLVLHEEGKYSNLYGTAARTKFEQLVPKVNFRKQTSLSGRTAMGGKVVGTATVFKWGDDIAKSTALIKKHPILIAGQTRPSIMPIIRLAKGIVTDEGGVTSHAAIVARELKIPTIIGTVYATDTFKTGDTVVLDADNGVVERQS
jgi:phosphohistidine swiveling domain-containing protein